MFPVRVQLAQCSGGDICVGPGARTPKEKSLQKCQQRTRALVLLIRGQNSSETSVYRVVVLLSLPCHSEEVTETAGFLKGRSKAQKAGNSLLFYGVGLICVS